MACAFRSSIAGPALLERIAETAIFGRLPFLVLALYQRCRGRGSAAMRLSKVLASDTFLRRA